MVDIIWFIFDEHEAANEQHQSKCQHILLQNEHKAIADENLVEHGLHAKMKNQPLMQPKLGILSF